jgi:Ca2+-binding RTX toxin-like protein
VTYFGDLGNPGKFIVQFSEDAAGTSDTLTLRASGSLLEYKLNDGSFTTDLDSDAPGTQSLALSAISRIDALLAGGNDTLVVTSGSVIPAISGIVFTGNSGEDTLVVTENTDFTLTASSLTTGAGGVVSFTSVEQAQLTGGNSGNVFDAHLFTGKTTLDGANGDDTMIGGGGDDVLQGKQGKDFLDGRGGNDQLFSSNSGTTLLGGDGDDSLFGGNSRDILDGGAGNDQLFGGNGQDDLFGGADNDTLDGGNGNDLIDGGQGTDRVVGSANVSWTLTETSLTGEGTDVLASVEQAQLTGGGGNNTINASTFHGATTLQGGGGIDTLIGGFGINLFVKPAGEIGNVTMIGGPAGSTNEYCLWPQGATALISTGGFDQINFKIAGTGVTLDLNVTNGTPQIVDGNGSTVALTGQFDDLLGSDFGDTVMAASDTNVNGGGGIDTLVSTGKSNVQLSGGADADTLQQSGGTNIVMSGDDGADALTSTGGTTIIMNGGADADSLTSSGSTQITMTGGADADTLQQSGGTTIVMNGDDGLDTLVSSGGSGITMNGGADADSLISTTGTGITMTGGADADTLQQTGGSSIIMSGDDGADSLTSSSGTGITINGGADADTLQQSGGTTIVMNGGSDADTLISTTGTGITMNGGSDADTLQQSGGTTIVMSGDSGLDVLVSSGGSGITMSGGADADTLQQSGGTTIVMSGDSGLDVLTSMNGNDIRMNGGADADTLQQSGGTTIVMSGDGGLDVLVSSGGSTITMNGGADADTLIQSGGTTIVMNGDDGLDTLVSTAGSGITMNGGADADTLQQSSGTTIVMSGDGGLDSLISSGGSTITMNGGADADSLNSTSGASIIMNGGSDADSLIQSGGTTIVMNGDGGLDTLVSIDGSGITMNGGADSDRLNLTDTTPTGDAGTDTLTGGDGNDTYIFAGNSLGGALVNESAADGDTDTLDFSSFTAGGITLDIAITTSQSLGGGLVLALSDGMGIENVVGTAFADTILGNGQNNLLLGADLLPVALGVAPGWDGFTQQVYLDFDSGTDDGEHDYTIAERDAIQARLVADYALFHFQFSQTAPGGDYATVVFNQLVGAPPTQLTGGFSSELDFRNLNPGGTASVQVNGILGASGQPADTSDNWIALSAKIAAHELGHLVGLLHQDSFGPITYGIHAPPGAGGHLPAYPGPAAAYETFDHVMSSPASVGSNRFNDTEKNLFFGEREAIKLAFSESGTVVAEANTTGGAHDTTATAEAIVLTPLAVPNTLVTGLNSTKAFSVEALVVTGSIALDGAISESDYYSFSGRAGDVISLEVMSLSLTRLFNQGPNFFIDPMVRIYAPDGTLLAFGGGNAFNDDQFEPTDASLIDLTLPVTGTYYVEVDTFPSVLSGDVDVGQYELFIQRFDAWDSNDVGDFLSGRAGNDVLKGGLGNDSLDGGTGTDVLEGGVGDDSYSGLPQTSTTILDAAGKDRLNFSTASSAITVNLSLDAGQVQTISTGKTLALNGTIEIVFGSNFADSITGNSADNTLSGGNGADTLNGGLGNDVVLGGAGNDDLEGGEDRDLLVGGLGADLLKGQNGDDILIGSRTTFEADFTALGNIMAEWTSANSYSQRVAYLTGTPGGANGTTYLIKNTTVLNDSNAKDTMFGGLGADLFFSFSGDKVDDKQPGETVI